MKRIKFFENRNKCNYVKAFIVEHTDGSKYLIYANSFEDLMQFLRPLDNYGKGLKVYTTDCYNHNEKIIIKNLYFNKRGNTKKRPFWYRGRVYKLWPKEKLKRF